MTDDDEDLGVTALGGENSSVSQEPSIERETPRETEGKEAQPKDLKGQLRASFERHKSPAKSAAAQQRARDEVGKFAPTEAERQAQQASSNAAQQGKQVSSEGKPPEAQAALAPDNAQRVPAPEALSKDIRAIWGDLDPKVQAEFIRRENDSSKGVQQLKDRYRPIDESIAPYRPLLQQMGKSEGEAINQLFGWHNALSGPNKAEAFKALARSHGFDISTLAAGHNGQPQGSEQQQQLPPVFHQITQDIGQLKSQFQREQEQRASDAIASFSKNRPHFDKARAAMAGLMQAGIATSLEDAYDKAIWADPDIRTAIQQEDAAKREAEANAAADKQRADAAKAEDERKRKEAEERERARKASVSPRGTSPTGAVSAHRQQGKSVGSDLREAIRQSSGSV